jgi:membrane-bound lytic murein transglycosylase B
MTLITSRRTLLLLATLAPLLTATAAAGKSVLRRRPVPHEHFDLTRPEIREFIAYAAERTGLDAARIHRLLADAVPQKSILEAMSRPAERVLPWYRYRERFLTERRIDTGVAFWSEHAALLARISREHGVAPEYLIAILGVETSYGRSMGHYRVLDALATLGFDYPERGEYFRRELEQFLLMAHEEKIDPLAVRGSYAGAMGAPQFMPSSFRRYAVNGDEPGRRDLWHDWSCVLASIANYFVEHGWHRDEPVLAEASTQSTGDDPLAFELGLGDTLGGIRARGYEVASTLADSTPAMLVPAEQPESMSWRVGFTNFFVITRYNRSPRYAMAVHDLAQALKSSAPASEAST